MEPTVHVENTRSADPRAAGGERGVPRTPGGTTRVLFILPLLVLSAGVFAFLTADYFALAFSPLMHYGIVGVVLAILATLSAFLVRQTILPYTSFGAAAQDAVLDAVTAGERYELALRGASVGFWDYNVQKGDVFFSAHLMSMLGYSDHDHSDNINFWHSAVHPNDIEGVKRTLEYHLDRRTPDYFVEYRIKKENGEFIWVEDRGKAMWGLDQKPVRVAGVMKDVSNEKRVQSVLESRTNELEEARIKIEAEIRNVHKFQMAVDSSTEAVSITTPEGAIVYVNPAWTELNGWSAEEAMGRKETELLRQVEDQDEVLKVMEEKLSAGLPFLSEEVTQRRKSGLTYHAGLSIYPLRENDHNVFFVTIGQDITQRKEVDRAKTEFVSLASHQLRTPLSAIRWYSEMLLSKYAGELNDKQRQYVNEIYAGNLRMVDLVNALLNTSRIDLGTFAIEPEDVSPVEICKSVIGELQPQLMERKQHVAEFFSQAPQIYRADPKLLRIIFQNFLTNSVKYTPESGTIQVEIAAQQAYLYIRVSDNGYGIPKSQAGQIFKKLFRADNVRQRDTEGTGLGLYIVKAIVEASGGRISFDSEENQGTTFHVYLPISGMPKKTGTKGLS